MARLLLLLLLLWGAARSGEGAVFDATSSDFGSSYLTTSTTVGGDSWRVWNDQAAMAPVVGAFAHQANALVYTGSSTGIGIVTAGVAHDNLSYALLGTSLDMILARATDNQGIYVVARAPGDLLATPALLVPLNPTVAMTWTADPWGPDYAAHPGQTLTYQVMSLTATAPRSGLAGCLKIQETNSYNLQKRIFFWQVGTPWPVEVQDDRSLIPGTTLTWTTTPATDLIALDHPVGVWIRQGGNFATGEYRIVAFFANGTWGRFQRLATEGGTSLWQIGTWRVSGPGTIDTSVTYRVGNPTYLNAIGSTTTGQAFSQSPSGALTFNAETYDRAAQTGTDGAYWFGQDPDGFGVIADLDGVPDSGDKPVAGLAIFASSTYLYWQDLGGLTSGSEWGTTANVIPFSGFDATKAGDENGPSGFANGAVSANFSPGSLLAPSILPGMGVGSRIAAAEFPITYDFNGATSGTAPGPQSKVQGVTLILETNSGMLARSGFTFAGWNMAADGSGTGYAVGGAYTIDAPVLLFAAWTPLPTYAVTYASNGATSGTTPAPQFKVQGVPLFLQTNTGMLTRSGFTFAGWNTAADGSGTGYSVGGTYTIDAPVLLFAAWTPLPTYAVTYASNGATTGTVPAGQTKTQGVALVLSTSTGGLGKTGTLFGGWNTLADGSGIAYVPSALYVVDAPLTLFAVWTPVPGGGSPSFGFVDGAKVRQVIAGDRVSLPLRVNPNLGIELLASVVISGSFVGLDAANGNWPSPAVNPTSLEMIGGTLFQRLSPGVTQQALVVTIPSGANGTMTIAFGPEVQGLIASGLTSSVVIRAASTTPMPGAASDYVAGQNLSLFSVQAGDSVTQQALSGTAVSGPQDLNLVAVNGTPPYTATVISGAAEIRAWKPFAAAVDWDADNNADTGQWFTIVPRTTGAITIRLSDSAGQSRDSTMPVTAGNGGSATVVVPASSTQEAVYTLSGAAGFGGVDALLARFQGAGANPLIRRGFVYGPRSKAWFELPTLPTEGRPMPWDGFYLADRTGEDLQITVEAMGVPPYIPLYPGWNVLSLPPLRQSSGTVLPAISAIDLDLYDEFGNTIARSAFAEVMGRPQTWNGTTFVELTSLAVGQGFFLKNNLSGTNPRMLYLVPGRQALTVGVRAHKALRQLRALRTSGGTEIVPPTGIMGRPPAPQASANAPVETTTASTCGGGGIGLVILSLGILSLRLSRRRDVA